MRDIRPDIKERLDAVEKMRERLLLRLVELDAQETTLREFLTAENARWHSREPTLFGPPRHIEGKVPKEAASPVTHFLTQTMGDGAAWSLERLKDHASNQGVLFGDESPGRSLHGGLLGLKKRGIVEMLDKGVWRLLIKEGALPAETGRAIDIEGSA